MEFYYCDQSSEQSIKELVNKIGPDLDFIIDDGSHVPHDQVLSCQTFMPLLKQDVIYIIEDVADLTIIKELIKYEIEVPKLMRRRKRYDDWLVIARHAKPNSPEATQSTMNFIIKKSTRDTGDKKVGIINKIGGSLNIVKLSA